MHKYLYAILGLSGLYAVWSLLKNTKSLYETEQVNERTDETIPDELENISPAKDFATAEGQLLYKIKSRFPEISTVYNSVSRKFPSFPFEIKHLYAIIAVESQGNQNAIGPTGDYGLCQITQSALDDVNRIFDGKWLLSEMLSPIPCMTVCLLYLYICYSTLGNVNDAIRAYNVGPTGARNGNGYTYLSKVQKYVSAFDAYKLELL